MADVALDLDANADKVKKQFADIEGGARAMGGNVKGIFAGAFAALSAEKLVEGVTAAFAKVTSIIRDQVGEWITAATEASQVDAQLTQAVKTTGAAAGFSAKELADMATELEHVSTFSDEAIKSAETLLLKFKNIKGDNFKEATKLAVDMAARLGTDVSAAASDLGRKLNDPVRAINLLKREGIALSAQQQDMIKAFIAVGDKAAAQRVVMDALNETYEGAAETAANAAGGGLKQLKEQFNDIEEVLGGKLLQAIGNVTPALKFLLEQAGTAAEDLLSKFLKTGEGIDTAFGGGKNASEKLVGAVAFLSVELQKLWDKVSGVGRAWRSLQLGAFDLLHPQGGMDGFSKQQLDKGVRQRAENAGQKIGEGDAGWDRFNAAVDAYESIKKLRVQINKDEVEAGNIASRNSEAEAKAAVEKFQAIEKQTEAKNKDRAAEKAHQKGLDADKSKEDIARLKFLQQQKEAQKKDQSEIDTWMKVLDEGSKKLPKTKVAKEAKDKVEKGTSTESEVKAQIEDASSMQRRLQLAAAASPEVKTAKESLEEHKKTTAALNKIANQGIPVTINGGFDVSAFAKMDA